MMNCIPGDNKNKNYNRILITQYHTNSVYSRSAIISVIALLLTNQLLITLYCTPTSAKRVIGCWLVEMEAWSLWTITNVNKILSIA